MKHSGHIQKKNHFQEGTYMPAIPQWMAQKPAVTLKILSPIRRNVGRTVIGPINLIRKPIIPVNPVMECMIPERINDPAICK